MYRLIFFMSFAYDSYAIRMSFKYQSYVLVCHSHVIRMSLVSACILSVCTRLSLVCHSYVLVCHPYVTRMHSYVALISLVCTRISSICHSYDWYVIRMSLLCTPMSPVCRSYVLVCHPYVTRIYSEVIHMSLVRGVTMSLLSWVIFSNVFSQEKTKKNYVFKWNILKTKHNRKKTHIAFSLHHWLSIWNKKFWDLMISAWVRAR